MAEENEVIFTEVQRFSLWCYLLLVCAIGFSAVITLYAVPPEQSIVRSLGIGLPILFLVLFLTFKMETEVHPDGLYVRFFPVHIRYKKFGAADLEQYYARTYKPMLEYGGWGIKHGFGNKGKVYNASGNKGVQLVLTNGKKLLIGSQKPDDLVAAIDQMLKQK
ncbi:MAG: hypothetical protein FVQ85_08850 [Planctomycetes bacterium]|nr:hypothetical protein [Planctomycetota bacterium]